MASEWNDKRPMAPHLQIWRWHPAMMSSILHRASAIISYAALIKFSVGLIYFLTTGNLPLEKLLYSPLGAIGMFVGFFALIFMALAQLRHLIWDRGLYFEPKANNTMSVVMILGALIGSAALTVLISGGA